MRSNSLLLGTKTPVTKLYGVGEKRAESLARAGIYTALDLAYHFPRGYEFRGNVKNIKEVTDGEVCSLVLTVASPPHTYRAACKVCSTALSRSFVPFQKISDIKIVQR